MIIANMYYQENRKGVRYMSSKQGKIQLRILCIGNSHTYFNDMPLMVKRRAVEVGYDCQVTMIAHGGWYLAQHAEEPDVRFNILYGGYDYVVLQEHAHPFGPEDKFMEAAKKLNKIIRETACIPVIYECWAKRDEPEKQSYMNEVHQRVTAEIKALLAPVGEYWWGYMHSWSSLEMYAEDGAHASRAGSDFAAKMVWETIRRDMAKRNLVNNTCY